MKTHFRHVRAMSALAIAASFAAAHSFARDVDPTPVTDSAALRPATEHDYKDHGFDKMKGSAVHAADGKRLGDVSDLLLDARSGEVKFVIVTAGGFVGLGGERRLLPVGALIRDPKEHGFITRLQQVDWDLLPTLEKADLNEGRIRLTSEQRGNLEHLGDSSWARAFAPLADAETDARVQHYILATALAGKPLYGENEKVGKVEDLYVDPAGGPALAVVEIDRGYVPTNDRTFFVPIGALEVPAGENGRVHTTLTAAQFEQVAGVVPQKNNRDDGPWTRRDRHERTVQNEPRRTTVVTERIVESRPADNRVADNRVVDNRVVDNAAPTPTGYSSGFNRLTTDSLNAAAQSIRDGWSRDPALNKYPLQVSLDGRTLVLSGTLPTARLAQRAEDTAHRLAADVAVANRIRVEDAP
jgi:uncharacterized protein YrrD